MNDESILHDIAKQIANSALETGAIKLRPNSPFTWASGYRMPVYNDNRLLLSLPKLRQLIARGMQEVISQSGLRPELIAGTATAGIPAATTLADLLDLPLVYVRAKPKDHGMKNLVEGKVASGALTVLVEDLLSTGGSAINAVSALREVGADVRLCVSVFSYEFTEIAEKFGQINCHVRSLLGFAQLIEQARDCNAISVSEYEMLLNWRSNPFHWADSLD